MVTSVSFTATTPYNAMGSPSSLTMQQQSPRQQKSQQPMPLQSQMQQNQNDEWFSDDDESVTPPALTTAYVLYDFDAKYPEELSVSVNEVIVVIEVSEKGWLRAYRGTDTGYVSSAYRLIMLSCHD